MSPFNDGLLYLPDVLDNDAKQLLPLGNKDGSEKRRLLEEARNEDAYARGTVRKPCNEWLKAMSSAAHACTERAAQNSTQLPGSKGLLFFDAPSYIQRDFLDVADVAGVDVVFADFIESINIILSC